MDLSIAIVSYNTRDKLRMTLQSVFNSKVDFDYEVFVVDNNSTDGSKEMVVNSFPLVKLMENSDNLGFSKANNQALRKASGRYFLLLNSDVEVEQDTFDTMIKFMDNNLDAGVAGCKVLREGGKLDQACRRSFPTPWVSFTRFSGLQYLFPKSKLFARYNLTFLPDDELSEVDSVMGAFLMIRSELVEIIGLLDEDFFMYGEDIDWCFRAKQTGSKIYYVPDARVVHYKGSSSKKASKKALYEFHRSMQLFYDKHYKKKYSWFTRIIIMGGVWKIYYLRVVLNIFRSKKVVSK